MPFKIAIQLDQSSASVATLPDVDPRCTITFVPRSEGWVPIGFVWSGEDPAAGKREELIAQAHAALCDAVDAAQSPSHSQVA